MTNRIIDFLDMFFGSMIHYSEKVAPYMITAILSVIIYQLFICKHLIGG